LAAVERGLAIERGEAIGSPPRIVYGRCTFAAELSAVLVAPAVFFMFR